MKVYPDPINHLFLSETKTIFEVTNGSCYRIDAVLLMLQLLKQPPFLGVLWRRVGLHKRASFAILSHYLVFVSVDDAQKISIKSRRSCHKFKIQSLKGVGFSWVYYNNYVCAC